MKVGGARRGRGGTGPNSQNVCSLLLYTSRNIVTTLQQFNVMTPPTPLTVQKAIFSIFATSLGVPCWPEDTITGQPFFLGSAHLLLQPMARLYWVCFCRSDWPKAAHLELVEQLRYHLVRCHLAGNANLGGGPEGWREDGCLSRGGGRRSRELRRGGGAESGRGLGLSPWEVAGPGPAL